MTIVHITDNTGPRVENFKGNVIIGVIDSDTEQTAIIMSPAAAIETGLAALRIGNRLTGNDYVPLTAASFEVAVAAHPTDDCAARIVFDAEGARFGIDLSDLQITELAAGLAVAARSL